MKKRVYAALLILTGVTAVFGEEPSAESGRSRAAGRGSPPAFSLSAGAGGILGGVFTRYTLTANGTVEGGELKIEAGQEMNQFDYGFFAFLDATYGEFSVFYQKGVNNYREPQSVTYIGYNVNSGKGWESVLGFSLLGKYPFKINERLTVFPLLGMDCQISLTQKRAQDGDGRVFSRTDGITGRGGNDKDGNAFLPEDWNSWWANLGGGLDFTLAGNFFLRGELLYGFRLMTSYEEKNLELVKSQANDPKPKLGGLTSGPSIRLCAGYRFF